MEDKHHQNKQIWIMNHYAANMYYNEGGRHYWFAKNLMDQGYDVKIFCANVRHNTKDKIEVEKGNYRLINKEGITFVFIKTPPYKGNGRSRIKNMMSFYLRSFSVARSLSKKEGKPGIILASSVHPLTLVSGIKNAKKMGIPCICEVRDLWPESIVEFGNLKRDSLIAKVLYQGERWIYKRAQGLIFTMEGGREYIKDQGWDRESGGPVNLEKVYHINNGIDLEAFEESKNLYKIEDPHLKDSKTFKVIYAGSIRKANNLDLILEAAKYVSQNSKKSDLNKVFPQGIKFLIYGDGEERERLELKCKNENITNVIFKGKVEKKYIPGIVSQGNLNILNYAYHDIWKYGGSQNKNFEYLASGRPILSTITMGYDIIEKYGAGVSLKDQSAKSIGEAVIKMAALPMDEYQGICGNAREAARDYDFKVLTKILEQRILEVQEKYYQKG